MARKSRPLVSAEGPLASGTASPQSTPLPHPTAPEQVERTIVRRRPRKRQLSPAPTFRAVALEAGKEPVRSTSDSASRPENLIGNSDHPRERSSPVANPASEESETSEAPKSLPQTAREADLPAPRSAAPPVATAPTAVPPPKAAPEEAKAVRQPTAPAASKSTAAETKADSALPDLSAAWMRAGTDMAKATVSVHTAALETWLALPLFGALVKEQLKAYNAAIDAMTALAKHKSKT